MAQPGTPPSVDDPLVPPAELAEPVDVVPEAPPVLSAPAPPEPLLVRVPMGPVPPPVVVGVDCVPAPDVIPAVLPPSLEPPVSVLSPSVEDAADDAIAEPVSLTLATAAVPALEVLVL